MSWNSEGLSNSRVYLGKVDNLGNIILLESTRYLTPTPSYIDYHKVCVWETGEIMTRKIYKIIFLHIYNEKNKVYDKYYSNYFSVMVSITNDLYDGIDSHILVGSQPLLRDENEMIQYIEKHGNDEDIIAFLGTSSYLFLFIYLFIL